MSEAPVQEISARAFVPVLSTDEIEKIPFIIKNVIENVNFIEDLSVIQSVANYKGLSIPLYESIRKFCSIARITPESAIVIATKANISEYFSSISTLIRIINNSLKSTSNTHSYIPNSLESIVNNCKSILKVLNVNLYNPLTLTALQEYKILAYQKYKANASKADLDNMPILNKIKSKIEYLGSRISLTSDVERKDEFPFIAVIGPSFMGKTQLAFTLARTHPVLYFNFIVGESRQSVYKVFERISSELESCLSDDLKKVNGRDNFGAALSVIMHYLNKNIRYKSLSFIYALLERAAAFDFNDPNAEWMDFYLECGPLAYSEMTFAEYYQKISKPKLFTLGI